MSKSIIKNKVKRTAINFQCHSDLWELVVNNAKDNFRSINGEILFCVKEQYKFEREVKEMEGIK